MLCYKSKETLSIVYKPQNSYLNQPDQLYQIQLTVISTEKKDKLRKTHKKWNKKKWERETNQTK